MTYYKVVKNERVIDVLDSLQYVRVNRRHNCIFECQPENAQGFYSSDKSYIFRIAGMPISTQEFDTVELIPIDIYEYRQLKVLNCKSPEEIIDAYTLALYEGGQL